ncbi:678_t:CDS:2, partial [Gigaspora rosea]
SLEFPPPDEICDTEGKSIKNFVNYVLVPTKTNNGDFDMVIFEQKVGDTGYIAINIECKFSYPGRITKLSNNEIKEKYEHTKNKYYTHVRYERQKIRNSPMSWEEGKFMTDLPDVGPLDNEVKNNKNIIIVKRENLEKIYTPSLVTRPHFYKDILEQIKYEG